MGPHAEGGRAPHRPEMDRAVCGAVAEGPDAEARWKPGPEGQGHAARQPDLPVPRQLVPALGARCLDGSDFSDRPVRALCGRCGDPLRQRIAGPLRAGCGRASARHGRVGAPPGQDEDRVLQGQQAPWGLRGDLVYVLWLHVSAPEGVQPAHGGSLHGLPAGGLSGEADGDEPSSCIMAASPAHDPRPP